MPKKLTILPGQKFGRWAAIKESGKLRGNCVWECQCSCGTVRRIAASDLHRGVTGSCGCASAEQLGNARRTHGLSRTAEYHIWRGIIARCTNPTSHKFRNYGGRGITLCAEWRKFTSFMLDMGKRPSKAHSIERVDNDKGYTPSNCVWATTHEQNRNKRTNHRLTYKGESYVLTDLARKAGIDKSTLKSRLQRGWSMERTVETAGISPEAKTFLWCGEVRTVAELAAEAGVKISTMRSRLKKGSIEQAMTIPAKYSGPPRKVSHKKIGSKYWHPPVEL